MLLPAAVNLSLLWLSHQHFCASSRLRVEEKGCGGGFETTVYMEGFDKRRYPAAHSDLGPDPAFSGWLSIHKPCLNGYSIPIGVVFGRSQLLRSSEMKCVVWHGAGSVENTVDLESQKCKNNRRTSNGRKWMGN
ncbi:hypothetical protein B0H19DRAFT_1081139 [Mycena capillaripes]|nr:hypothetical protein B0H19DRAFT_1081139 [Mycena capillaripes]